MQDVESFRLDFNVRSSVSEVCDCEDYKYLFLNRVQVRLLCVHKANLNICLSVFKFKMLSRSVSGHLVFSDMFAFRNASKISRLLLAVLFILMLLPCVKATLNLPE